MEGKNKEVELNIDLSPEIARGVYSNFVVVTHSVSELVLDFSQMLPGTKNPVVRERVIMSPIHAKRLLMALGENIKRYENQFGTIEEPEEPREPVALPYDIGGMGKA